MNTVVERLVNNSVVERLSGVTPEIVEIITTGPQGPSGSGSGGDVTIPILAAENLPAYTFVTAQGNIGNSANTAHYGKVVGITTAAVLSSAIADVVTDTEVTNSLWSWSPGAKLFLNGTSISATPPSSGFSQLVAVARNATIIIVRLEPPILL